MQDERSLQVLLLLPDTCGVVIQCVLVVFTVLDKAMI